MVAMNICMWKVWLRSDNLKICSLQLLTMSFAIQNSTKYVIKIEFVFILIICQQYFLEGINNK